MQDCFLISAFNMSKVAHNFQDKTRTGDVIISESVDFTNLLLSGSVLNGLKNAGFVRPSPIQLKAIPLGRCGLDLIVQAKSGTGKTCVFSVIALESIVTDTASMQVLVLAPTREIAVQIWEVINSIGSAVNGLQCHTFIGGMPLHEDRMKLRKCHIAVGSPGRIKQLIECGALRTDSIRLLILDEADKLLEDSFQQQINWIYSTLPENKQMLALSATYPEYLADHLTAYMRNPTFLRLNISDPALLGIRQYYQSVAYHPMSHVVFEEKTKFLAHMLSSISFQQCLVFSNLQTRAQTLADTLTKAGWPTSCIAGCLDQTERNNAMAQLKTYKCRVLISTDLTSRGIDADKVNLVVNMDIPKDHETYLHRIGRAGRFGSFGIAITLISEGQERLNMNSIEKRCNTQIHKMPDPIPSDLAKPDCPIFLDDVVSSVVINTGTKRQSLPKSPRKNEVQSQSKNNDNHEHESDRTDNISKIESIPSVCIYDSDSELELSDEQTKPVSEHNTVNNKNKSEKADESTAVNGSLNLTESLVNGNNDADKIDEFIPEIALNRVHTNMSCSKSTSQEVYNSGEIYDQKMLLGDSESANLSDNVLAMGEILNKDKCKHKEHEVDSVKSHKVPKFCTNNLSKIIDMNDCNSVMNVESNIPFLTLENLDITGIMQQNIGYKKLSTCYTYKSARESLMDFRNRLQNTSDDGSEINDTLQTYCCVPDREHSDTESLRKAISQLQNIHECSVSSLISSHASDYYSSSAGNVFTSVAESTGDIDNDITNGATTLQKSDTENKPEQFDRYAAEEPKQGTDFTRKVVLDGADLYTYGARVVKPEGIRAPDPDTRRKRFGYRGNFAIAHLLQHERGKNSYHCAGETDENIETGQIVSSKVENVKQLIPAEPMPVENGEQLINRLDTMGMESDNDTMSEDSKFPETMTKSCENYVMFPEKTEVCRKESSLHSPVCNILTSSYDRPQHTHFEASLNQAEVDDYGKHLNSRHTDRELPVCDSSQSESSSSSEVSDSDTDSGSESDVETDSVTINKQDGRVRRGIGNDMLHGQSRSLTSDSSDSKACDSGVYSRPSYEDYCHRWYNDWYTYCLSQQRCSSSNQTCSLGYYAHPSAYDRGQTVYDGYHAASVPHYWQWNPTSPYMHAPPGNQQSYLHGDIRSRFYPTYEHQTRSDQSSLNSPESMQDVFKFQSEYIKQMSQEKTEKISK